jgi:RNA polymerase sigma factor (sigma-70 family)
MYRSTVQDQLSQSELDAARLGFTQTLLRKRFSPQFVANHRDDLLSTARLEYTRRIAEGVEIENPAGWIIHCAWRRTQNLLEAQKRGPRTVSIEKLTGLGDESAPTPEQTAQDEDRVRKVREAVAELSEEQRRLIALTYFEEMAVREAARYLDWHPSKAQRCHEAALRRLHEVLGVQSSDELVGEIGLAAWLSLASSGSAVHLPAGIEAALEQAGHGAAGIWARTQELARRFLLGGGGEPASAAAVGGAARAAGVCASAVAVACFASGVIGPGIGGVGLLGAGQHRPAGGHSSQPSRGSATANSSTAAVEPTSTAAPASATSGEPSSGSQPKRSAGDHHAPTQSSEKQRAKEQFSPFARSATSSGSTAPAPSTASTSSAAPSSGSSSASSSTAPSGATQAKQQFGAFK